jgi:hypothetical protein
VHFNSFSGVLTQNHSTSEFKNGRNLQSVAKQAKALSRLSVSVEVNCAGFLSNHDIVHTPIAVLVPDVIVTTIQDFTHLSQEVGALARQPLAT